MKVPCPHCNGTGRNLFPYHDEDGLIMARVEECKVCKGSKEIEADVETDGDGIPGEVGKSESP